MHFLPENRMCAPPFVTKQRPPIWKILDPPLQTLSNSWLNLGQEDYSRFNYNNAVLATSISTSYLDLHWRSFFSGRILVCIAGYGYFRTEASPLHTCTCALRMGVAEAHMCYPISSTLLLEQGRSINFTETLCICGSYSIFHLQARHHACLKNFAY